jgi:hypothetical protein
MAQLGQCNLIDLKNKNASDTGWQGDLQFGWDELTENGIYGAKITGGGAGGTIAVLASVNARPTIQKIFDIYARAGFGDPYLFEGSSDGQIITVFKQFSLISN